MLEKWVYVEVCLSLFTYYVFVYWLNPDHRLSILKKVLKQNSKTMNILAFLSEKLIFEMADRMAEDGFKEAGYEYVSIDVSTFLVTYYPP